MKYSFDMDFRHAVLGLVLLFCLAVITIFAAVGVSWMEENNISGLDYDHIWIFFQIWAIVGVIILPLYIIFFTKFNNPIRKKEDKK